MCRSPWRPGRLVSIAGILIAALGTQAAEPDSPRALISLNGAWLFQTNGAPAGQWKTVQVPSSIQSHEGTNFHGVGWYRKTVDSLSAPAGKRVLLHFQAAATAAEVWLDGERLGTHLGGWTPFRFDVTDVIRNSAPGQAHEIKVRLDEKIGHNTQGFLPIIEPHFGGLWQDVQLVIVPETYCDDLGVLAVGDLDSRELRLEVLMAGTEPQSVTNLEVHCRLRGEERWRDLANSVQSSNATLFVRAPFADSRPWSPAEPNLYEIELRAGADRLVTRAAFRSIATCGQELRLNGHPLNVRGVLNWGYSAPHLAPNPGEAVWRSELEFARAHGFNLMKFCLWVPPQRYLELADEMGVLTWMEYPTWHPDFTQKYLEPLRREFSEFFRSDRNHPSVILRSLTCETGPSAELKVMQSLYDTAHRMIPGAVVEDDSSWIQWNRVHDFYDDHPYGNNDTWVKTLGDFSEYILGHGLKPLVLGESISADTWIDREAVLGKLGSERPWWAPAVLDDLERWTERMRQLAGPGGLTELRPESLRYGMLMRKYQVEAYRREQPYGGYVITVLRDIPSCSMGLLDYLGQSKWTESDWAWHGDTMCLLKTDNDRRSFASGESLKGEILLSHFGLGTITNGQLRVTLESDRAPGTSGGAPETLHELEQTNITQNPGTLANLTSLDWQLPEVSKPRHLYVRATLKSAEGQSRNEWPLWVVPATNSKAFQDVQIHSSLDTNIARELFPGAQTGPRARAKIAVASKFDDVLAKFVEHGGRVLLLPDGKRYSLPLNAHWFLRGAPYIPDSALTKQVPRELLVELQHFDLSSPVVPNVPQLDSMDPLLLLWDTHDQKTVKTHGLVFETRIGRGRLLVSALRHTGPTNAAGRWLLQLLLEDLRAGEPPGHTLPDNVWQYAKARLHADQTNLVSRSWLFKPDPKAEGLAQGWHKSTCSEADWKPIRIGDWWENQGYPALDGWAWYRRWVAIPRDWDGKKVFLSFEGVDDMYELYVNGEFAGKGGDLATRQDALHEKKSHDITRLVKPGQRALLAVRVYDWYGYGGIFRPITLGTLALNPALDWLR